MQILKKYKYFDSKMRIVKAVVPNSIIITFIKHYYIKNYFMFDRLCN